MGERESAKRDRRMVIFHLPPHKNQYNPRYNYIIYENITLGRKAYMPITLSKHEGVNIIYTYIQNLILLFIQVCCCLYPTKQIFIAT